MILSIRTRTGQILSIGDDISIAHETSDRATIKKFILDDNGCIEINVGGNKTYWIESVALVPKEIGYNEQRKVINKILSAENDMYYKSGRQVFGNTKYRDLYLSLKDNITKIYNNLKI